MIANAVTFFKATAEGNYFMQGISFSIFALMVILMFREFK